MKYTLKEIENMYKERLSENHIKKFNKLKSDNLKLQESYDRLDKMYKEVFYMRMEEANETEEHF